MAVKHDDLTHAPACRMRSTDGRVCPVPLWCLLVLLIFPLLACGFGAPRAADVQAESDMAAVVDAASLPPLYLAGGAGLSPETLLRIAHQAEGEIVAYTTVTPHQSPNLQTVRGQPHVAFRSMLLSETGDYFRLTPGFISPDSRLHIRCDQNQLELRELGRVDLIFTAELRAGVCAVVWSPDGLRFAFATPTGVAVYAVDEDEVSLLPDADAGTPWRWSPSGTHLLVQIENALRLYARDGTFRVLSIEVETLQDAHWSSDGTRIFLLDGRGAPLDTNAGRNAQRIGAVLAYDVERDTRDTLLDAERLRGTLEIAPAPDRAALAAWHVDCRRVLSEFVPVLVLECESELRLLALDAAGQWQTRTLWPHRNDPPLVARTQSVPEIVWADWRTPLNMIPGEVVVPPREVFASTTPPVLPLPDPDAAPGTTPWAPIPLGADTTAATYRYRVHEVLRGDAASSLIYAAALTSDVAIPAPGYEHLAVRLGIAHIDGEAVEIGQVFFPRLYSSNWVGTAHLMLIDGNSARQRRTFSADERLEIWIAFIIARNETAPVMRLTHDSDLNAPFYMALSDVGGLPATPALIPQAANAAGLIQPVETGIPVITRDWQIEMLGIERRITDAGAIYSAQMRIGYQGTEPEYCGEIVFAGVEGIELYTPRLNSILSVPRLGLSCFLPGGVLETSLVFTASSAEGALAAPEGGAPAFYFRASDAGSSPLRYFALGSTESPAAGSPPQLPAPAGTASAQETAVGNRARPLPPDGTLDYEHVRYSVVQMMRGAAAARRVRTASSFNQNLSPDMEYVVVEVEVENLADRLVPVPVNEIAVTGGAGVLYRRQFLSGIGPAVPAQLPTGAKATGWLAYAVAEGEPGLALVIPAPYDADLRATQYLALEGDAGPATLTAQSMLPDPVVPNTAGLSLDAPAPFDTSIVTTRWQMDIVDLHRGDTAWEMVQAANTNNQRPPTGYEYVVARVRLHLLAIPDTVALNVTGVFLLDVVDAQGNSAPSQTTVAPQPRLNATLFAGGVAEGWFVDLAPVGAPVFLEFEDHASGDAARYVALP